jgi:cell division septation protein DedD
MKSSVVIPIVLVVCLLLLAFIISRVFGVQDDNGVLTELDPPPETEVVEAERATTPAPTRFESTDTPRELRPATDPGEDGVDGNYLVLAGTFRQLINARTRVRELQRAGFERTSLEYFDRGTFAVALAGRYGDYGSARDLVDDLRRAGFEAQIMEMR